jgi:hypothetical protein
MMIPIVCQLVCSATMLHLWVRDGNEFNLWFSGVSFGAALFTAAIETSRRL